jgi:hypothetical protein
MGRKLWILQREVLLATTITNDRLRKAGYIFFSDYYKSHAPVYSRTAVCRTVRMVVGAGNSCISFTLFFTDICIPNQITRLPPFVYRKKIIVTKHSYIYMENNLQQ